MVTEEVVFVGAGAAHLVALRRLAMRPLPARARLTLVVPEAEQPYSGLVPAVMAGRWRREDASVDLAWLARAAGARLVLAEATGLDVARRELALAGRPPLRWDWVSLCPGSEPALVPGAAEHAVPLKPLSRLLDLWEARARPGLRVLVAGGGAAGVEAALAARARGCEAALLAPTGGLLAGLGRAAARLAAQTLAEAGVPLTEGRAARVEAGRVALEDGRELPFDLCLWAAGASGPPRWLDDSGLGRDAEGWLLAEPTLRSAGQERVFLAGDAASVRGAPRPRNGVFSVRAGLPLAENLRAALEGRPPRAWRPQRRHLALLQAGDAAIAARGGVALKGRWALRWKDRIDRRWVESLRDLPAPMPRPMDPEGAMRCAGCGAKLPALALRGALARLGAEGPGDDAATLPPGASVASVDLFRPPVSDPWLAGRIAAAHALGDLAASGAEPRAALALVALPHAGSRVVEEELFQLLHGARSLLREAGAALVGGHSAEGAEAMLGFAVAGEPGARGAALPRGGMRPGDALVLTKPLGAGAILAAAAARGPGWGRFLPALHAAMARDPLPAARALLAHGARAAADVTGFGLLGHILEMCEASRCGADLFPDAVPAFPGALEALRAGVRSTGHPGNAEAALPLLDGAAEEARLALLLDPQTSGGLLAALPAEHALGALSALREGGHDAALVGFAAEGPARVRLQPGLPPARCAPHERGDGDRPAGAGKPLPAAAR